MALIRNNDGLKTSKYSAERAHAGPRLCVAGHRYDGFPVRGGGVRAHRAAGAGPADRDCGGDRLREWLDHARAAHGVRGTLRQKPLRPASQRHSRRRNHARPQPEELTVACFPRLVSEILFS